MKPKFGITKENEIFVIRETNKNDYEVIPSKKYIELYFGEIAAPPFGFYFFKKE
ncbi:MAG: hypothetical protein ACLSWM_11470 [Barnesiella sp.]|jgi:hypothetical protein|nr:hypothetical protein [Barnesiella sp. GGCC_0306]MBS7038410.1 hypothetical protein [Bacteroidales bacterium]